MNKIKGFLPFFGLVFTQMASATALMALLQLVLDLAQMLVNLLSYTFIYCCFYLCFSNDTCGHIS